MTAIIAGMKVDLRKTWKNADYVNKTGARDRQLDVVRNNPILLENAVLYKSSPCCRGLQTCAFHSVGLTVTASTTIIAHEADLDAAREVHLLVAHNPGSSRPLVQGCNAQETATHW